MHQVSCRNFPQVTQSPEFGRTAAMFKCHAIHSTSRNHRLSICPFVLPSHLSVFLPSSWLRELPSRKTGLSFPSFSPTPCTWLWIRKHVDKKTWHLRQIPLKLSYVLSVEITIRRTFKVSRQSALGEQAACLTTQRHTCCTRNTLTTIGCFTVITLPHSCCFLLHCFIPRTGIGKDFSDIKSHMDCTNS